MRIKSYIGKLPQPRSFEEGAEILRRLFSGQFPKLDTKDWLASAHRTFKEEKGQLVPNLRRKDRNHHERRRRRTARPAALAAIRRAQGKAADGVRGANSDLLTGETVAAMRARRKAMDVIEVPDQGHAPLLTDAATIGRISEFVDRCDRTIY